MTKKTGSEVKKKDKKTKIMIIIEKNPFSVKKRLQKIIKLIKSCIRVFVFLYKGQTCLKISAKK